MTNIIFNHSNYPLLKALEDRPLILELAQFIQSGQKEFILKPLRATSFNLYYDFRLTASPEPIVIPTKILTTFIDQPDFINLAGSPIEFDGYKLTFNTTSSIVQAEHDLLIATKWTTHRGSSISFFYATKPYMVKLVLALHESTLIHYDQEKILTSLQNQETGKVYTYNDLDITILNHSQLSISNQDDTNCYQLHSTAFFSLISQWLNTPQLISQFNRFTITVNKELAILEYDNLQPTQLDK